MGIMKKKKYLIGCDDSGLPLKKAILEFLDNNSILYEDIGVNNKNNKIIYPKIAKRVVDKIKESNYQKEGILICGTGIGMSITANKFYGIYAAVCHNIYDAERARLSNNTNVITMGARVIGFEVAKKIIEEWISLEFQDSSSTLKLEEIKKYENNNFYIK